MTAINSSSLNRMPRSMPRGNQPFGTVPKDPMEHIQDEAKALARSPEFKETAKQTAVIAKEMNKVLGDQVKHCPADLPDMGKPEEVRDVFMKQSDIPASFPDLFGDQPILW